jgi:predicted TIM-barrel fold metal-dependent hydrolase
MQVKERARRWKRWRTTFCAIAPRLPLSTAEREKVYFRNAQKLFGLAA